MLILRCCYKSPTVWGNGTILEPALRFVTKSSEENWGAPDWSFPQQASSTQSKPFLTEQAVRVAEGAAASLTTHLEKKQRSRRKLAWITVAVLVPLILLAVFIADREEIPRQTGNLEEYQFLDLGPCTRTQFTSDASEPKQPRFAHDVVMLCNSCHVSSRPGVSMKEETLRLKPPHAQQGKVLREETSATGTTENMLRSIDHQYSAAVIFASRSC